MKKILTIQATYEIDESEYDVPVDTYETCMDDYDNIGRPIYHLEDLGWKVQFVSLKPENENDDNIKTKLWNDLIQSIEYQENIVKTNKEIVNRLKSIINN